MIKAAIDKLLHGTLLLPTRLPTPPLEQPIIERWVLGVGPELDLRWAVKVSFRELDGEWENSRRMGSPTGEEHTVPGMVPGT